MCIIISRGGYMNTVVVYVSKSGYVKNYAEWIAKALEADIFELSKISIKELDKYETIIFGGGIYVSGINKVKFITKNNKFFKNKNVVVFASGATPLYVSLSEAAIPATCVPCPWSSIGFVSVLT